MKSKLKYMHTLGGKPAYYVPNRQICFASRGSFNAVRLCDSVKQIHKEERASNRWRMAQGFSTGDWEFGWVNVKV